MTTGGIVSPESEPEHIHEWIVWDDTAEPIAEDVTEDEANALIEENEETRYAECAHCGETINA